MKAWEPRQVQSRLAFSDEEEEDLLDFMYKYKTLRKTEIPLEVHGVWAGGACVCARASPGDLGAPEAVSWGARHCRAPGAGGSPSAPQGPGTGQHPEVCQGAEKTLAIQFGNRKWDSVFLIGLCF